MILDKIDFSPMHGDRVEEDRKTEVGDIWRRLAHDARGPLSAARASVQVALTSPPSPNPSADALSDALVALDALQGLLADVTDVLRPGSAPAPRLLGVDLATLLLQAKSETAARASMFQHEVVVRIEAKNTTVPADATLLRRLVRTLLENSLRYAPGNSRVQLVLEGDAEGPTRLRVHDDGPTIPSEFVERLFEPLGDLDEALSTLRIGTFASLPFCRQAARRHGWRLTSEAGVPTGHVFCLDLREGGANHG